MRQFLWKWAVFIALNALLAVAAVAFFEGHMTGTGWGILAFAGAALLLILVVGALLYLRVSGDDLNAPALIIIILMVLGIIAAGAIGWNWLRSVVETDWRFWLAVVVLPAIAALEVFIGQIDRQEH
jgi:peptidoglycan/LPS O-acetylase OafA/YrhL